MEGLSIQTQKTTVDELVLSPEIDKSLEIFEKRDILDSRTFNAIECINCMFPDEKSIDTVDTALSKLQTEKRLLEKEIRELVQSFSDSADVNTRDLELIKKSIHQLYDRINAIKEKAAQSERVVVEITKDLKKLDIGKQNLTSSITFLKRLQMLVSAMGSLKMFAARKEYPQLASIIEVLVQLFDHFKAYKGIQEIQALFQSFTAIQNDLKKDILLDFEGALTRNSLTAAAQNLVDGCKVFNAMENDAKKQLIDWYCEYMLKDYRSVFRSAQEAAGLEDVSRRFSWLKRLLKVFDEAHSQVFPAKWNVAMVLTEKFCLDTRKDFSDILMTLDNQIDVKVMVQAMLTTIEFEQKLEKRFPTDQNQVRFLRFISSCFDPYLDYYIKSEDQNIQKMMETYTNSLVLPNAEETVLPSSTDLLYYFKQTMIYCSGLSTGKPFLNLCRLFGKWLQIYAEMLNQKYPKEDKKSFTDDDFKLISFIINTADYCWNTIPQLQDKLVDKINQEYKNQIKIAEERDVFLNSASLGVKMLVKAVETMLEPHLQSMLKMNWAQIETVGDQSTYVTLMSVQLMQSATVIKRTLTSQKYFKMFCDKFADSFLIKFYNNILKFKAISRVGAEQMLLDTHALKGFLYKASVIDSEPGTQPPSIYTKLISKGIYKVEQLLKTIMTGTEVVDVFVDQFLMMYSNESNLTESLQKILELKGIKRPEQMNIYSCLYKKRPELAATGPQLSVQAPDLKSSTSALNSGTGIGISQSIAASKLKDIGKYVPKFSNK